jgi:cytochrome c1
MALNWTLSIDHGRPNVEFMPEMVRAVPYESFAEHPGLPNKAVLQPPADGTIARGQLPLHYQATPQDAERAGEKLHNPFKIGDKHWQPRGAQVYANFCGVCHGPGGAGDGPVSQRGVPPPPSLLATKKVKTADGSEKDVEKFKDGQLFHIITFGQNNMAAYGAQLSREDRWAVILHLRQLQNVQGAGK